MLITTERSFMGKIKVRTLGGETEEQEKKEQKQKKEEKKLAKVQGSGGQRVPVVEPSEEELERLSASENLSDSVVARKISDKKPATTEKKKKREARKRARSKKYLAKVSLIDKSKKYPLNEAIELLEKLQRKTFDETVELHLNTSDPKIQASTTLPHGTGKTLKVKIASDELIEQIEKGKVDFDILLANPFMMPKLGKVAKVLGPKGLMPNPKNGTITNNPEEAALKYQAGLVFVKTESKAPIIHIAVGKVSFGPKKLEENIEAVVSTVKKENISQAVLKSTMSPAIKLSL